MTPPSPALFLSGAASVIGMKDGTVARDVAIMKLLKSELRTRARTWALALVHHAGYWSHFDNRSGVSTWPIPAPKTHADLARFAARENVLSYARPEPGEVFLLWSPAKDGFVHTGIVLSAEPFPHVQELADGPRRYECHTIEAEVTNTGCLHGNRLGRVRRVLSPDLGDRSIRWPDLDVREEVAQRPHEWRFTEASTESAA